MPALCRFKCVQCICRYAIDQPISVCMQWGAYHDHSAKTIVHIPTGMWHCVSTVQHHRAFSHLGRHFPACRFQPERTLYLAFGQDEEVGGGLGAKALAAYLRGQGVQLEYVLDEGGPLLVDGLQPFIKDKAVALVGTAEKVPSHFCFVSCVLMLAPRPESEIMQWRSAAQQRRCHASLATCPAFLTSAGFTGVFI